MVWLEYGCPNTLVDNPELSADDTHCKVGLPAALGFFLSESVLYVLPAEEQIQKQAQTEDLIDISSLAYNKDNLLVVAARLDVESHATPLSF